MEIMRFIRLESWRNQGDTAGNLQRVINPGKSPNGSESAELTKTHNSRQERGTGCRDDVSELWNAGMSEITTVDVGNNHRGCRDVHNVRQGCL